MKKKFYVFLDIDGVLYDWVYIKEQVKKGKIKKGGKIDVFNPESIIALNLLIEKLEKIYDVRLVISSAWRHYMDMTVSKLKDNGLVYDKKIESTPISTNPKQRGKEIRRYLMNKENYDYVVIDDEDFDFEETIPLFKRIKTSIYSGSLNKNIVNAYFNRFIKR